MDDKIENDDTAKIVITCEPTIDINFASTLHAHLARVLQENRELDIHAGDVTKVDTAILQVFVAFMIEAKASNLDVNWISVSEAFRNSADLLGLSIELNLPQAA